MLTKIISGGQTGADQAGLRAARRFGIPTGGTAPKGWATEAGPAPWLADFGLKECPVVGYPARTGRNVADADVTLFFGDNSSGYWATHWAAAEEGKLFMLIMFRRPEPIGSVAAILRSSDTKTVNISGNRESRLPGVGLWVERYLSDVFRLLGFVEKPC